MTATISTENNVQDANGVQETVAEVIVAIEELNVSNVNNKIIATKINELIVAVNQIRADMQQMPTSNVVVRDRGPKSEKVMSETDAHRIMLGDLKNESHKKCAEVLKLSYGQVYSARKGFTFKPIYKAMITEQNNSAK